uniref:epigen isoform X2 n=1 Tax=Myodes glareolus TaxID=447135 RepID=UPI002020A59F|nr:epigen isoform X2 [Myodes glareolus]
MALGVAMVVSLLFKAMAAALTEEEAEVRMTMPPTTAPRSNWTVNDTEADYIEEPVALKFSHPCLEDHNSYCINGMCAFHHELEKAICRCFTGYTGERCECLNLKSPYIICSGGRPEQGKFFKSFVKSSGDSDGDLQMIQSAAN